MAEALGLGASIIAVLQISGSLVKTCKQYIEAVRDYPGDLRVILIETSSLMSLLENLQFLEKYGTLPLPIALEGPVQGCRETLSELAELLPAACEREQSAPKRRRLAASLAWPLRQTKARRLLDQLMRHKTSISAAISTESWQDTKAIKQDVESLKRSLSESDKHKIRHWLQQVNPSSNHNTAMKLYESGTGDWVLRSPSWDDWISCKHQGLWIHGIPGAGKTILAAHLAEVVNQICKKEQSGDRRLACVYYYCLHSRNHCETLPFLRWLLSELCHQSGGIPQLVEQLYTNSREPTMEQLLLCLEFILADFDTVFVVIDALDESQPRQALLELAKELVTDARFKKLQILATSREYHDIE
ncbi:hypothetical protein GQ53DRAFT_839931 [Thozetella sp. PMI_491]|nr:hypothetical protein GQ53DRAFT_839931 [Thozetella sp. PMI_491]